MTTFHECPHHDAKYAADHAVALTYELTAILREEVGYHEQFATPIAEAIVRGMRRRMGGEPRYIPADDKADRDASIRREFDGRNRVEICRKYGISKSRLYQIVGKRP